MISQRVAAATTAPRIWVAAESSNIAATVALVLPPHAGVGRPAMATPARQVTIVGYSSTRTTGLSNHLEASSSTRALWRDDWRWPSNYKGVLSLTVEIPQGLLNAERYWLEVTGPRSTRQPEVVATYVFDVERR